MSTQEQGTHTADPQMDLGDLTTAIRAAGFEADLDNTGGGIMVIMVKAGSREVTISGNGERGHDCLIRPYHGAFYDDEGDGDYEAYDLPLAAEVVSLLERVRSANPPSYWVWRTPAGDEVSVRFPSAQAGNEFCVKGCQFVEVVTEGVSMTDRIQKAVRAGEEAFWAEIAGAFPEARYGDFSPEQTSAWDAACNAAVVGWIRNNVPGVRA